MYDSNLKKSIKIEKPIDEVFEFLTNPNKIPLVMPSLVENTDVPELPMSVGSSFNYKYQLYGVIFEGDWTVEEIESPIRYVAKTSGIESYWKYDLSEAEGGTMIDLVIEYTQPSSLADQIATRVLERINQKECEAYLENLKTLLEMS